MAVSAWLAFCGIDTFDILGTLPQHLWYFRQSSNRVSQRFSSFSKDLVASPAIFLILQKISNFLDAAYTFVERLANDK